MQLLPERQELLPPEAEGATRSGSRFEFLPDDLRAIPRPDPDTSFAVCPPMSIIRTPGGH